MSIAMLPPEGQAIMCWLRARRRLEEATTAFLIEKSAEEPDAEKLDRLENRIYALGDDEQEAAVILVSVFQDHLAVEEGVRDEQTFVLEQGTGHSGRPVYGTEEAERLLKDAVREALEEDEGEGSA